MPQEGENKPLVKDRSFSLVALGILDLAIAALVFLLIISIGASAFVPGSKLTVNQAVIACGTYALLAAFFLALGIGLCLRRRWARALGLVAGWFWLVVGLIACVAVYFVLPPVLDKVAQARALPPEKVRVIWTMLSVVLGFLYIVLPLIHLFVLGRKHVRETVESHDPKIRWTDACPLPVLGLSGMLALGGLCCLLILGRPILPFFGSVLGSGAAQAAALVLSAAMLVLAWATYALKPWGWWGTALLFAVWGLSSLITFLLRTPAEIYGTLPPEQLAMIQSIFPGKVTLTVLAAVVFVIYFGYLGYCRKYFKAA